MSLEVDSKNVDYYKASDGRIIAIHIKGDFNDYDKFPPYLDTDEAKDHIRTAYAGQDIEAERNTKAHMTDDEVPLQIIVLNRPKGSITKAHYHVVEERTTNTTRHQILLCQRGKVRVGVFTKEGGNLGDAILHRDCTKDTKLNSWKMTQNSSKSRKALSRKRTSGTKSI